jgi:hypothetical protein
MLLSHGNGIEMVKTAKIKRRGRWINGTYDDIYKFYGLKQQEESNDFQHLITCPDKRDDKHSTCGVDAEDVTIIEQKVKQSEHEEQHHSPKETKSEIHSLLSLIVVLDEKAQTEKHSEDSIHLSGEKEEYRIPYASIDCTPERAGRLGKHIEVQLFDEMDEYDSTDGDTPENIRHIDSCVGFI